MSRSRWSNSVKKVHRFHSYQKYPKSSKLYHGILFGGGALSAIVLSYVWNRSRQAAPATAITLQTTSHGSNSWLDYWFGSWNKKHEKSTQVTASSRTFGGKSPASRSTCPKCKSPVGPNFIADAVEMVLDSVVNISVESDSSGIFTNSNRFSYGTGFVISEDGSILTNAHVVSDVVDYENAKLTITASDGVQFQGILTGMDTMSDLAVIKAIPNDKDENRIWKPAALSENSDMRPGDWVVAIGSPLGLQNTVTAGVISSGGRKVTEIGGVKDNRVEYIQTDCVVHPGSSGGPLINIYGEVIGVNTSRADQEGISFAIRVDDALGIIKQMASTGRVVRPWLGATLISLSPQVLQQIRLQGISYHVPERDKGALVTFIHPESPAERAGLLEGDVILSINGHDVGNGQAMYKWLGHDIGKPVEIVLERKVALDVDWDGRVFSYESQIKTLNISPDDFSLHEENDPDFFG